jgi:hypothetical protein
VTGDEYFHSRHFVPDGAALPREPVVERDAPESRQQRRQRERQDEKAQRRRGNGIYAPPDLPPPIAVNPHDEPDAERSAREKANGGGHPADNFLNKAESTPGAYRNNSESDPSVGYVGYQPRRFSWEKPRPLPSGLTAVAPFDLRFLPGSIALWVADIADRMQCPLDFVAVPALVALGSVLGRKIGMRPKRKDDWMEVPNIWGGIVGRPGMMKSPAMGEALKPLNWLDGKAREGHSVELKAHASEVELHKLKVEVARDGARRALKEGLETSPFSVAEPASPKAKRYVVNDTTYEKLGEILFDNPNGVLAFRDEIVSLLKTLDREEFCAARGFFLAGWNGTGGYTFDRIIRGTRHIDAVCLSLLGSTQPGPLAEYVKRATAGGVGDDGLIQRFNLLVWPDQTPEWKETDRYPDSEARTRAWEAFERLDKLDPNAIGAERDQFESVPFLRFDDHAQGLFSEWHGDLERRLRRGDMASAVESHLAKYRTLVPAMALINHLADGGTGQIPAPALARALAFAEYLETHALRVYGAGAVNDAAAAKLILARIRKGSLTNGFSARDIRIKEWSGLTESDQITASLELLTDGGWVAPTTVETRGRPYIAYSINPEALR